eukprot:m.17291 g.17291  ORF g.17291 m.17291 type:complete len:98 (+) comp11119_c0_seq1:141-434(+)
MAASFFVQDSVVECLFAAGAKEDLQDKEGKTALDIAQEEHLDSIVAILQRPPPRWSITLHPTLSQRRYQRKMKFLVWCLHRIELSYPTRWCGRSLVL